MVDSIQSLLRDSLINLKQVADIERSVTTHLSYLNNEMFVSLRDIRLAIEDKESWSDLKLPIRLKLEMKRILLGLSINDSPPKAPARELNGLSGASPSRWKECYSSEHLSTYFYNVDTAETQWELPVDAEILTGDNVSEDPGMDGGCSLSVFTDDCGESLPPPSPPSYRSPRARESNVFLSGNGDVDAFFVTNVPFSGGTRSREYPPQHERSSEPSTINAGLNQQCTVHVPHAYPVLESPGRGTQCAHLEEDDVTQRLLEMGFQEEAVRVAVNRFGNNLTRAAAALTTPTSQPLTGGNRAGMWF